jgi:hypothetical protein
MTQQTSKRVPFAASNMAKCKCPGCPVQWGSRCVAGQAAGLNVALKKQSLSHEQIPGLYCSAGVSSCTDIFIERGCLCGECPVYFEYELKTGRPLGHYCSGGPSR